MSIIYFVSRHAGAVEWARRQGLCAELKPHLDIGILKPGDAVIGSLPVSLAADVCGRGARYLHLVLPLPEHLRGKELSADDMESLGASIVEYHVTERR